MCRFYCPTSDFSSQVVSITDKDELHHLREVLRLKKNDAVDLFNGNGMEASGCIVAISPLRVDIRIQSVREHQPSGASIILACAVPKKTKFELIVEKATELGVREIIPLKTSRTEVKLDGHRLSHKFARYKTVAVNAAKQSNRAVIPLIHPITAFPSALKHLTKTTTAIIPSLSGKNENLLAALGRLKSPTAISVFIGPEGDFTLEEYRQAQQCGCIPVSLGETILKVETAAICAVSCVHLFFHH